MYIQTVISYVIRYEDYFCEKMGDKLLLKSQEAIRVHKKLTQDEKRLAELDRLFLRIYEDNVGGRISDERFAMMSKTYEDEQALKCRLYSRKSKYRSDRSTIWNCLSSGCTNMPICGS